MSYAKFCPDPRKNVDVYTEQRNSLPDRHRFGYIDLIRYVLKGWGINLPRNVGCGWFVLTRSLKRHRRIVLEF